MTILDSNVLSAWMKDPAENRVVTWLDRQDRASIWTTSVTILEIRSGLLMMPDGRRPTRLAEMLERFLEKIEHRVASFDEESANFAANLLALRKKRGKIVDVRDTMIAGIVLTHRARLATRNTSHFDDIGAVVVNPWTA